MKLKLLHETNWLYRCRKIKGFAALLALIFTFSTNLVFSQVTLQTVDFEIDGSGYTVSPAESNTNLNNPDYWIRTDGTTPVIYPQIGFTTSNGSYFFAAEDLDYDTGSTLHTVTCDATSVIGYSDLQIKLLVGGRSDISSGIEGEEYIKIQYNMDGGGWVTRAQFIGDNRINYYEDANADGTIDGPAITTTLSEFTYTIPITGSSVEVRIEVYNGGGEEIAFDNIRVLGTSTGNSVPTAASFTASPIYQNTAYAFATANFGYSDSDGDPLDHIRVTAVPGTGTLWIDADADGIIDGTENTITNGETITKVELDAGKFKYINTSGSSSSFTFDVNDGTDYSASPYTATLTVTPEPTVTLSLDPSSSISENGGTTNVKATLSHTFNKTVTVNLAFTGTASGSEYSVTASSISITSENTNNTVAITGIDDVLDEGNETVIVDISSVTNGSESGTQQVTCTLTDDDPSPTVAFNSTSSNGLESLSSADLQVDLSVVSGLNVSVDYAVTGTATGSGTDYTLANGTLTINAGDVNDNITIAGIVNDLLDEDNETVIVTLSNPINASLGTNTIYTYTIIDDDELPTVTTQEITDLGATSVTANGNITDLGVPNPTQHGFCYNKTGSPTVIADSKVFLGAASATGTYSTTIYFLDPLTTYYIRAYVTNDAGTSYGEEISFTTLPLASEVTTQAVTGITTNSAIGNGNITDLGVPSATAHGVCWNTAGNPTVEDSHIDEGTPSGTGTFTSTMTDLIPKTFYCVKAYATNDAGTSYGIQVFFTTLAEAPSVTTTAVTELTTTSATLSGIVNAKNASTTVTFEYGTSDSYGTIVTADESPVTGISDTPVSHEITGLSPNTTYHYRVVGVNDGGTSNGADMTFITTTEPAIVTTQSVTSITQTTATGNGNITDLGMPNPTAHGVCWNTTGTPTNDDSYSDEGTAIVTGAFTSEMTSLIANTSYYVRAYATNTVGTVYGEEVTFSTLPDFPVVTTDAASDIESSGAILNGTVNANDLSTTVTFEYGLTEAYGSAITADQSPVTGTSNTEVSVSLTGLSPNTTYHYRVVGENSEVSVNGEDQTFTTIKYDQLITFNALADKTTDDTDFDPGATSNLGLIISYASSNELVATIVSDQIHIIGAGITEITASQEGNDTVNVATPVNQSLTVTEATGIESTYLASIRVYPNPASELLNIDVGNLTLSDNVKVSIVDLSGKTVFSESIKDSNCKIDVSDFSSGLYFVEISTSVGLKKLKLIIE